jgi:type II secretory pathway component PulC
MFEEMVAPLLFSERGRQVALGLLVVMAALILFTGCSMIYGWINDFNLARGKAPSAALASGVDAESRLIAQIPAQHLFGSNDDFLPITSLQLHLTGILSAGNKGNAKVIISQNGQVGKVYALGDAIASGIKINAINEDGIVLEHGGKLEKLPLPRQALDFQAAPKTMWENG